MQDFQIQSDLDSRLQNILIECWHTDGRTPRCRLVSGADRLKIRNSPECAEFVYQIMMKARPPQERLKWLREYYAGYHCDGYLPRFARRMCLDLQTTTMLFERAINDTINEIERS